MLLCSRIGFGTSYLVRPKSGTSWVGRAATRPGGRLLLRAIGARDLALSLGALNAVRRNHGRDAAAWFAAQAIADGTDFAATWSERDRLSSAQSALGLAMAGVSTAAALAAAEAYLDPAHRESA
jgi:hypothetical protein